MTADEAREVEAIARFAGLKARQCADQAFGDSRVEDAGRAFEDIATMLERLVGPTWDQHTNDFSEMTKRQLEGRDILKDS